MKEGERDYPQPVLGQGQIAARSGMGPAEEDNHAFRVGLKPALAEVRTTNGAKERSPGIEGAQLEPASLSVMKQVAISPYIYIHSRR